MEYRPLPPPIAELVFDQMMRLQVPGVAAGVVHNGVFYAEGFGLTNVNHPLPVTPETLFQIGSTSKTVTATVLMQLVEEGRVDVEGRVQKYLPEFRLQSEPDAAALTLRHLVTHRGGWAGDYFRDTGRGEDAIAKIVAKMANSPQLLPVGTAFSYNNAGFYVLARIIEVIEGRPFESVVQDRVFRPLGMDRSFYFPEDTMTHRVAAGHIVTAEGPRVTVPWNVARSIAGGGGVISNVVDQLRYAAFHCGDGAAGAARLLKPETMAFIQTPQAEAGSMCDHVGVSWMIDDWPGVRVVKHGGATNGHLSGFDLVPVQGFGCTVLTNADAGRGIRPVFFEACVRHFLGVEAPAPARLPVTGDALRAYQGTYRSTLAVLDIEPGDDGLVVKERARAPLPGRPEPLPPEPVTLRFTGPDRTAILEGPRRGERCEFLRDAAGAVAWVRWDGRVCRRDP